MQEVNVFIGVDVAKAELVTAVHDQAGCRSIANEADAISAWLRELPDGAALAVESTGRYHQLLATLASAAGLQVFVLNARDVYFYAKALGARAKTDRVDAHVIARYVAEQHTRLRLWQVPHVLLSQVQCLLGQRWTAVSKRTALRQSLQGCDGAIACQVQALDAAFAALLQAIDARIMQLFDDDAPLRAQRKLLQEYRQGIIEVADAGVAEQLLQPVDAVALRLIVDIGAHQVVITGQVGVEGIAGHDDLWV